MIHNEFIRQRAKELGYSVQKMANTLKITRVAMTYKLENKNEFTASEIIALAHLLQCRLDKIITKN